MKLLMSRSVMPLKSLRSHLSKAKYGVLLDFSKVNGMSQGDLKNIAVKYTRH